MTFVPTRSAKTWLHVRWRRQNVCVMVGSRISPTVRRAARTASIQALLEIAQSKNMPAQGKVNEMNGQVFVGLALPC